MAKNRLLGPAIIAFTMLFAGVLADPHLSASQEARPQEEQEAPQGVQIVKIRDVGYEGALLVEPREVNIPVGMVVVWVNMTRKEEPQIVFAEGMKCELSTESPMGFKMDEQKCYITDYVSVGGTSSLKFIGPGTFDYLVRNRTGQTGKGKIVVVK